MSVQAEANHHLLTEEQLAAVAALPVVVVAVLRDPLATIVTWLSNNQGNIDLNFLPFLQFLD